MGESQFKNSIQLSGHLISLPLDRLDFRTTTNLNDFFYYLDLWEN